MPLKPNAARLMAIALCTALAACGGGHHSASSSGTSSGLSGSFQFPSAKGMAYSASPSGLSGTTDSNGTFQYKAGDTVTFSLNVGASAPAIAFGSFKPVAPTGSNAQVFVLSLPNGLQLAQVLQSLDHAAAPGLIDVSGLALSSVSVNAINAYTASGGTVLPTGQTDVQMLAAAQASNTAANIHFTVSGGASVATTLANLYNPISQVGTVANVNLGTTLPGTTVFTQEIFVPVSGLTGITYSTGFAAFNGSTTLYKIVAGSATVNTDSYMTFGSSANSVALTQGSLTETLLIAYLDAAQVLWPESGSDGSLGGGTWNFIDRTFAPSTIAGKTLTLGGFLSGACSGTAQQLVIDAAGATYTEKCQGSTTQIASGTIAAVSTEPGVLSFTDTSVHYYIGLVAGWSIANGTVAVVDATTSAGGLISVTAQ